jgi:hypothetical protein
MTSWRIENGRKISFTIYIEPSFNIRITYYSWWWSYFFFFEQSMIILHNITIIYYWTYGMFNNIWSIICLIQDSNLPVAFNGISKSFPQWPVTPTQPLQFFRIELLFFFLRVRKPANWNTKGGNMWTRQTENRTIN